jgi:hypothetical protein
MLPLIIDFEILTARTVVRLTGQLILISTLSKDCCQQKFFALGYNKTTVPACGLHLIIDSYLTQS